MARRSRASFRTPLIVLVATLGFLLVPAREATAIIIGHFFSFTYDAIIVESDIPNLPVGALVPDNRLSVGGTFPDATSLFVVENGELLLAGLLSLPFQGARIFDTPGVGWRIEHDVDCPLCAVLFGVPPGPNTDIRAFTELTLQPNGPISGLPPDPIVSGMQTIEFVSAGVTIGTVVATVPEPAALALAATVGVGFVSLRRGRPGRLPAN